MDSVASKMDARKAFWAVNDRPLLVVTPNVELTGPLRRDGLARVQKMYRVPAAGPRRPAVEGPVERGVRPRWRVDEAPTFLPGANAGYPTGLDRRREVFSCLMSMGGEECTQTHFSLPR